MSLTKDKIVSAFAHVPDIVTKDSIFHPEHSYTNHELVNQTLGFVGEISKEYIPNTPIQLGVVSAPNNGAKVVVMLDDGTGYSTTVYAISKRTGVVGKLCDMFEEGAHTLTQEEIDIIN